MLNNKELLYVVDEFDVAVKPEPRHKVFKDKLWRRTVHIWIVNDKKQVLCQKRSIHKDMSPGKWEPAVTGHIGPEDNYFTGAARELFEETGLEIAPSDLNLFKIYKDHEFREYRGIFYYKWNGEIHEIKSEKEEVDEVKLLNLPTLKSYLLYKKHDSWIRPGYEKEILSHLDKK